MGATQTMSFPKSACTNGLRHGNRPIWGTRDNAPQFLATAFNVEHVNIKTGTLPDVLSSFFLNLGAQHEWLARAGRVSSSAVPDSLPTAS